MPLISNLENLPELAFDFVIVGGGSAGCVLASRLSEDNACKVLLVNANGKPEAKLVASTASMRRFNNDSNGFKDTAN